MQEASEKYSLPHSQHILVNRSISWIFTDYPQPVPVPRHPSPKEQPINLLLMLAGIG